MLYPFELRALANDRLSFYLQLKRSQTSPPRTTFPYIPVSWRDLIPIEIWVRLVQGRAARANI